MKQWPLRLGLIVFGISLASWGYLKTYRKVRDAADPDIQAAPRRLQADQEALTPGTRADLSLKLSAMIRMARARKPEALEYALLNTETEAFRDAPIPLRMALIEALGQYDDPRAEARLIGIGLRSENPALRLRTIESLGMRDSLERRSQLKKTIDSGSPLEKTEAWASLVKISQGPDRTHALDGLVASSRRSKIGHMLLVQLAETEPTARKLITEWIIQGEPRELLAPALIELARLRDPWLERNHTALLQSPQSPAESKQAYLQALPITCPKDRFELLAGRATMDASADVRRSAIEGFGLMPVEDSVKRLEQLLNAKKIQAGERNLAEATLKKMRAARPMDPCPLPASAAPSSP